jgi:hypothetical protein
MFPRGPCVKKLGCQPVEVIVRRFNVYNVEPKESKLSHWWCVLEGVVGTLDNLSSPVLSSALLSSLPPSFYLSLISHFLPLPWIPFAVMFYSTTGSKK